jgi:hypothetical protein
MNPSEINSANDVLSMTYYRVPFLEDAKNERWQAEMGSKKNLH